MGPRAKMGSADVFSHAALTALLLLCVFQFKSPQRQALTRWYDIHDRCVQWRHTQQETQLSGSATGTSKVTCTHQCTTLHSFLFLNFCQNLFSKPQESIFQYSIYSLTKTNKFFSFIQQPPHFPFALKSWTVLTWIHLWNPRGIMDHEVCLDSTRGQPVAKVLACNALASVFTSNIFKTGQK